jgi:hypothetical protein
MIMFKACDIHCTVYDFSIHMLHHNHRLLDLGAQFNIQSRMG